MPRVSEVLDYFAPPYLVKWKLRVGVAEAKRISDEALMIGTAVDKMIRDEINEVKVVHEINNSKIINCISAWKRFKQDHPEFLVKAKKFKNNMQKELKLGDLVGHPDFIFDDELPDLKTSKSINKSHWMQTAQYAHMYEKTHWIMSNNTAEVKELFPGNIIEVDEPSAISHPKINKISILRLDKFDPNGLYEYKVLEEPFISFWQSKFQCRYDAYIEESEFHSMMRKVKEKEKLL